MTEAKRDEMLARITPTADYADLAGCDLVVEAVFENVVAQARGVRRGRAGRGARRAARLEHVHPADHRAGRGRAARKQDFIGLHFFSPVDKMPLLEIIRGEQTSDEALARALDYAAQIKKTPIVVNDSRGFFTCRVIGTFVNEALAMLGEGVAAGDDRAGDHAGRLPGRRAAAGRRAQHGAVPQDPQRGPRGVEAAAVSARRTPPRHVVEKMVELGRPGRLRGAGFFDYDDVGQAHRAVAGSGRALPGRGATRPTSTCTSSRSGCSFIEAVESARCVEENVLITTADANIGSIMGIGFPPWTGGVLQYVNGYPGGVAAFVARADELAERYGERFAPNPLLRKKAENGETF